jgi:hypothetical protein
MLITTVRDIGFGNACITASAGNPGHFVLLLLFNAPGFGSTWGMQYLDRKSWFVLGAWHRKHLRLLFPMQISSRTTD